MKRIWIVVGIMGLCASAARGGGMKGEVASDRKEVVEQKQEMKGNAQEALGEESALKEQIRDAVQSGDKEKARELRAQLRSLHQGNAAEMKQDKAELGAATKELHEDLAGAPRPLAMSGRPPLVNPPGRGPGNPPGAWKRANPPGYNPPGRGPGNPPGYNPPGAGPRFR